MIGHRREGRLKISHPSWKSEGSTLTGDLGRGFYIAFRRYAQQKPSIEAKQLRLALAARCVSIDPPQPKPIGRAGDVQDRSRVLYQGTTRHSLVNLLSSCWSEISAPCSKPGGHTRTVSTPSPRSSNARFHFSCTAASHGWPTRLSGRRARL